MVQIICDVCDQPAKKFDEQRLRYYNEYGIRQERDLCDECARRISESLCGDQNRSTGAAKSQALLIAAEILEFVFSKTDEGAIAEDALNAAIAAFSTYPSFRLAAPKADES